MEFQARNLVIVVMRSTILFCVIDLKLSKRVAPVVHHALTYFGDWGNRYSIIHTIDFDWAK